MMLMPYLKGVSFLINTYTQGTQAAQNPGSISSFADGGFVVVFGSEDDNTGDTDEFGFVGRIYNAEGESLNNEFLINSHTGGTQINGGVATLSDGRFVTVWASDDPPAGDADAGGMSGRIFYADGTAATDEFLLNTFTSGSNFTYQPVAALAEGGFVAVWDTDDPAAGDTDGGVVARIYDAEANPLQNEFLVTTTTSGSQGFPAVISLADGNFVVAWQGTIAGDSSSIGARLYQADGTPVTNEFIVNTNTVDTQWLHSLTPLADGGFVATWASDDPATGDEGGPGAGGIAGQRYKADATPVGQEFLINTATVGWQAYPVLAGLTGGGFVAAWVSADPTIGDPDFGIAARQFHFADTLIVDVLANDNDADPDDILSLDSVTVTGELGQAWVAFNKLVFYAGTDFDYLDEGESASVTVCYTMSDASGFSSDASVDITVVGRKHVYEAQLLFSNNDASVMAEPEFLVNTYTGSFQSNPSAIGLSDNSFLVTWNSSDTATGDLSSSGIVGQRYGADGTTLTGEFLINTFTGSSQTHPSVSPLADGGFVVVWSSSDPNTGDTTSAGIAGQLYDSDGTPVGDEFLVNTNTSGSQFDPEVVTLADGSFVVVWDGAPADPAGGIGGRHFYANASPKTDEFLVNTNTSGSFREKPRVGALSDGGFVVAWTTSDTTSGDTDFIGIDAQIYDSDSVRVGGEFLVNTHTVDRQNNAAVLGLIDVDFIIAWENEDPAGGDSDHHGISAKRYDADGNVVEDEFLVNTHTTDGQFNPNLVNLADGGFLISWWSESQEPGFGLGNISARRYGRNGLAIGNEFRVNINTADTGSVDAQREPAVAALASGGFAIAWPGQTPEGDTDSFGVTARQYQFNETFIIDVLAHKAGIYDSSNFTLDTVEALTSGNGSVSIINNRLVFYAGTDFDYLDVGETAEVVINYTWTGNLGKTSDSSVTVKVIGRFSPGELSGLKLWLDTSSASSMTIGANNAISEWRDQSGNGFDLSQTSASLQPVFELEDSVTFDGSSDVLVRSDALGLTGSPDITVFMVARFNSLGNSRKLWSLGNRAVQGARMQFAIDTAAESYKYGVAYGNGFIRFDQAPTVGNIEVTSFKRDAGTNHNDSRCWLNGTQLGTETSDSDSLNLGDVETLVGAQDDSGTNTVDADIFEFIVYNASLSDEDREKVESYLLSKWGIK